MAVGKLNGLQNDRLLQQPLVQDALVVAANEQALQVDLQGEEAGKTRNGR